MKFSCSCKYELTGLDPAGPNFESGDDEERHPIGKDSGVFVDIIHTNNGALWSVSYAAKGISS